MESKIEKLYICRDKKGIKAKFEIFAGRNIYADKTMFI
jgi:hypothetical protein